MKTRIIHIVLFIVVLVVLDRTIGLVLNVGLNRYFGLEQHSEVLLIGHSHLMLSVDKENFEKGIGKKVSKYCREGVNVYDRYEMVKQYLSSEYSDSLKVVFYGVDQFMFNGEGLSQNSYKLFYPFIDNPTMNGYIKSSTDTYDYWLHKSLCSTRYSDALINSAIRGWMHNWSNYKFGKLEVEALKESVKKGEERHICFDENMIRRFEETISMITEKGIKVVLVNTPIAAPLNGYEPEEYHRIISYFNEKAEKMQGVYYWDLNPEFSERYDLFFDAIHLNVEGQQVVNKYLVERFNKEFYDISSNSPLQ